MRAPSTPTSGTIALPPAASIAAATAARFPSSATATMIPPCPLPEILAPRAPAPSAASMSSSVFLTDIPSFSLMR